LDQRNLRSATLEPVKPNPYERCGDNHACAATTMASMPVSKVG
jgi:hypothetical protein